MNIQKRMLLYILVPTIISLISTGIISSLLIIPSYRNVTINAVENQTQDTVLQLDHLFSAYENITENLASFVEFTLQNIPSENWTSLIEEYFRTVCFSKSILYNTWVNFEPDIMHNSTGQIMPNYQFAVYSDGIEENYLDGSANEGEYYTKPKNEGRFIWTSPARWVTEDKDFLYMSAARPIFNTSTGSNGEILGVVGTDVDLAFLSENIAEINQNLNPAFCFLIDTVHG